MVLARKKEGLDSGHILEVKGVRWAGGLRTGREANQHVLDQPSWPPPKPLGSVSISVLETSRLHFSHSGHFRARLSSLSPLRAPASLLNDCKKEKDGRRVRA